MSRLISRGSGSGARPRELALRGERREYFGIFVEARHGMGSLRRREAAVQFQQQERKFQQALHGKSLPVIFHADLAGIAPVMLLQAALLQCVQCL